MNAVKKKRRSFGRPVAEAVRQAWRDLRVIRWTNVGTWVLYWSFVAAVMMLIVLMGIQGNPFDYGPQSSPAGSQCLPDGTFGAFEGSFNWWTMPGFFDITLSSGFLTFPEVKGIDVVWQLIIGRGGQALLAITSWRVFADYVAARITRSSTTYATFWTIFLHQEPTITSTYRLVREFYLYTAIGSRIASIFIVGTIVFALSFPTLVNSMTGYVSQIGAYVEMRDGSMTPYDRFKAVAYVIHDGSRVNLTDDYVVYDATSGSVEDENGRRALSCGRGSEALEQCLILTAVSNYVAEYGFYGLLDDETTWMRDHEFPISDYEPLLHPDLNEKSLPAPALNVSGFYFRSSRLYGHDWVDPRNQMRPFQDPFQEAYAYSNYPDGFYSIEDLRERGRCQPLFPEKYQWGFSFIQLFIMLVILLIWSTGLCILWQKAHHRLDLKDEPEVPRGWRAVLEISRAMERELAPAGIDVTKMTDSQARKEIRERLRGGAVSLDPRLAKPELGNWPAIREWMRRDRWWIVAFALVWCSSLVLLMSVCIRLVLWYVSGGILAIISLGTTTGSRVIMLVFLGLVSSGVLVGVMSSDFPYL